MGDAARQIQTEGAQKNLAQLHLYLDYSRLIDKPKGQLPPKNIKKNR